MNIRKFKWILAFAGAVVVVLLLRGFALHPALSFHRYGDSLSRVNVFWSTNGVTDCGFLSCRSFLIIVGVKVLYGNKIL